MNPTFEAAGTADLDAIRTVLSQGDLPIEDVHQHLADFILAKWQGGTIGTAGKAALLRSLCVVPVFFEQHGFSRTSRETAPPGIRGSAQFRTLCPATAICMCKSLVASSST